MKLRHLIWPHTIAARAGFILLAFLLCILLPPWQSTSDGQETIIQYSLFRTTVVTTLGAIAALSFFWSAYKKDSSEPTKTLVAFGVALVFWIFLVLPGVLLTKLTLNSQEIALRECQFWGCQESALPLAEAKIIRLESIREPVGGRSNNYEDKTRLHVVYSNGTNQTLSIHSNMLANGYNAFADICRKQNISLLDERRN